MSITKNEKWYYKVQEEVKLQLKKNYKDCKFLNQIVIGDNVVEIWSGLNNNDTWVKLCVIMSNRLFIEDAYNIVKL